MSHLELTLGSYHQMWFMKKGTCLAIAAALALAASPALAAADADKGAKVFKRCKVCHTVNKGGKHRVGPNLFGVVGRQAGSTTFKRYKGLKGSDIVWDEDSLDKWLTNPKKFIGKRSSMAFKLKKAGDRAAVIAYLKSLK